MTPTPADILAQYEPLVRKVARLFLGSGLPWDDLCQAAREGILIGIRRYHGEWDDTARLTKCLHMNARVKVQDLCDEISRPVRLTRNARANIVAAKKAIICAEEFGFQGAEARRIAAEELNMSIKKLDAIVGISQSAGPPMEDDAFEDVEQDMDADRRRALLAEVMTDLTPRQSQIIQGAILDGKRQTDLGEEIGISGSRVSQILAETMAILQKRLTAKGLNFSDLV